MRHWLPYSIMWLSGIAGLGEQMVWARLFAVGLGHELPSVLGVVSAFFGGLALGAWLLDGRVSRSDRPGRWYAGLEVVIGVWGIALYAIMGPLNAWAHDLIGIDSHPLRHWAVAFGLPFVALLPATLAMGATLPAMDRFTARWVGDARVIGGLYSANTFGAVVGTIIGAFVLVPQFGLGAAMLVLASVNLFCAGATWYLEKRGGGAGDLSSPDSVPVDAPQDGAETPPAARRIYAIVFVTGLLGIGYEVLGVRLLGQVMENTVFSYAAALVVYLLGTAFGAALYQRFGRSRRFDRALSVLIGLCAGSCLLCGHAIALTPGLYDTLREWLGDGQWPMITSELIVAAVVFGLPTTCMGAAFSHLVQAARRQGDGAQAGGVGHAVAWNTLGGALAPILVGVVAVPWLGSKVTLVLLVLGYLPLLWPVSRPAVAAVAVNACLVVAFWPVQLRLVELRRGEQIIDYHEGAMATVVVTRRPTGDASAPEGRYLRVNNNFQMGSTSALRPELRQGHIPLLLHPAPRSALYLGLGTGITFQSAAWHPGLRAHGVELLPEVIRVTPYFRLRDLPEGYAGRLTVHAADARRFVAASDERFDVIIADLFHPGRDGAGSLYTVEHFQAVRNRLAPGGVFCQWLPLYQLDMPTLRIVTRTFLEVFPHARAWTMEFNMTTPAIGLVASAEPVRYGDDWFNKRMVAGNESLRQHLTPLALGDNVRLMGLMMFDTDQLHRFADGAQVNTDNHPIVIYRAPRHTYDKTANKYGRLTALMDQYATRTSALLTDDADPVFRQRLERFITARDVYMRGVVDALRERPVEAVDAFVESARLSEDFTLGYARVVQIAQANFKQNSGQARSLLRRLVDARPERPLAGQLLKQLDDWERSSVLPR